jgi:hypothetical protein
MIIDNKYRRANNIIIVDDGMGIVVAIPHPTKLGRSNNESNKMLASKMKFFRFISISLYGLIPPNAQG